MATLSNRDSSRMYSWWWDSHISPKNSKWLQENLTDMDAKVKAMIKLIEEDADSFARRAEMYYKKRPELMKLVEEFYRAYRALAERYDNATGVLRQAHRTMAEVFPNQVPLVLSDDSPASAASETDPRTPDVPLSMRAFFDPDDLQKDPSGPPSSYVHAVKRNGSHTEESDSVTNRKGLKQFNDIFGSGDNAKSAEGRVRKGLNFHDADSKENHFSQDRGFSESEAVRKFEKEIQTLKEALANIEAEKDAGLAQYQKSLERLSELESNVCRAQEDSRGLNERANKAECEVQTLREALAKLEAEKEASLLQYQQCVERIANLENVISNAKENAGELKEIALKAETEAQALKQDLATVESGKEVALNQYGHSLEMISTLENKLLLAEEDAKNLNERAGKAEREVEILKQALAKLTEEKEAAALLYQQCLETISSLERKISSAEEEMQRLNGEVDSGVAKLKGIEEQCLLLERSNQSLHSELESVVLKMGAQSEELTEKQKEMGRLWACLQEERLRFMEAETAFQTLQHLHSQTQEELRSLAAELQSRVQILRDTETHNQSLQDEVLKIKEENKSLNELNMSSTMSMKDMHNEIFSLRETQGKLEEEVELRVDQRNALQQEIYCLKEELNELNKNHQAVLGQVKAVGFSTESFDSSVKELQDENSNLKETCERERSDKVALLAKLAIMEQLLEKNALLEKSLSNLSAELEGAKRKINALEESFQSLLEEKSGLVSEKATLMSQLQVTTENLGKLLEKNTVMENSLSDAHDELEGLKIRSKSVEDTCQLLENEKSNLIGEKDTLVSHVETTRQRLEDLEKRYRKLEEDQSALEKEKESKLREVQELRVSLDAEKQELASFTEMSQTQLAFMTNQICLLQEEGHSMRRDFEEELDKSMKYQLEIFILQRCVRDLEEKSGSLLIDFQKLQEETKLSEQLISELEHENLEQQVEVKSLSDQTSRFRMGMYELLKALDIDLDHGCEEKIGKDQTYFNHILSKLEDTKDENQQLAVEMLVLVTVLGHLRLGATTLEKERNLLDQELRCKNEQLSGFQIEANKLLETNEELLSKLRQRDRKEEALTADIENLRGTFLNMHGAFQDLQKENLNVLEEKRSLTKELSDLEGGNQQLAVEMSVLVTVLGHLRLGATTLEKERNLLDQELRCKNEQLSGLQIEANKLLETNEELLSKLRQRDRKEEALTAEIENLRGTFSDMHGAFQNLQEENLNVLEEKRSLTKELSDLEGGNRMLEEENFSIVSEMLSLSILSLMFKNFINDKSVELRELGEDLEKLNGVNSALEAKLRMMGGKLEEVELENLQLKELLKNSEDELRTVTFVSGQLNDEIACGKDQLSQKDIELSEAEHKLTAMENEKSELQQIVQDLKMEYNEVTMVRVAQEKQILELSEDNHRLSKENGCLRETNREHEVELHQLLEEHEKTKRREESLLSEVQNRNNEIDLWNSEATKFFGELQTSSVLQAVLEEKVHELAEGCKSLEDGTTSKDTDIELLKETISTLEGENGALKVQLAAYVPAINSLKDSIHSLENRTYLHRELQKSDNEEVKDAELLDDHHVESCEELSSDQKVLDEFSELRHLQTRVKAVEQAVIEMERLVTQENIIANAKLEAAMRQIEELTSKDGSNRGNAKSTYEISELDNGLLTKDIVLDQISECSSYGVSKREGVNASSRKLESWDNADSQTFESWDTADLDGSIDLTVAKGKKVVAEPTERHEVEVLKKQKGKHPNSEILVEKEVGVDKLEISRTFSQPRREVNKTKILERLNSDVQKLTNLQITVQDLKMKMETSEKSRKGEASVDCDTLKEQLEEADEAILKFFDLNGKLMKSMEDRYFPADAKTAMDSDESGNVRRRRISEQARRVSEKIGRLQLEVQKIQFVLLKLDEENEKERKGRSRIAEAKRRILLRDYLYGGVRTIHRKKKVTFCACVQPPTSGD